MKAAQWIDRVKVEKNISSDYAVAKFLGVTQAAISRLRTHDSTLSEDTAIAVATALGLNPARVVLDQVAERTKSENLKASISELCILCKVSAAIKRIAKSAHSVRALA